jgi:predicted protein tyrosine phosphatase
VRTDDQRPNPQLAVFAYGEAAMFLRGPNGSAVRAVISIHGHREFGVEADVPHRLDLTFDDAEVPAGDDSTALLRATSRRRWAAENGLVETPPTPADAAAIVAFADAARGVGGFLLCHCGAGMSRAPAAALICLAAWAGAGAEAACAAEVRRLRRGAVPHAGLVRMADDLLGRGGSLVAALVTA